MRRASAGAKAQAIEREERKTEISGWASEIPFIFAVQEEMDFLEPRLARPATPLSIGLR